MNEPIGAWRGPESGQFLSTARDFEASPDRCTRRGVGATQGSKPEGGWRVDGVPRLVTGAQEDTEAGWPASVFFCSKENCCWKFFVVCTQDKK